MVSSEDLISALTLWAFTLGCLWISGNSFRLLADPVRLPSVYGILSGAAFWPLSSRKGYMLFVGAATLSFSGLVVVIEMMILTGPLVGSDKYAVLFCLGGSYWDLLESVFTRNGIVIVRLIRKLDFGRYLWTFRCVLIVGSFFQLLGALQWASSR